MISVQGLFVIGPLCYSVLYIHTFLQSLNGIFDWDTDWFAWNKFKFVTSGLSEVLRLIEYPAYISST